MPKPHPRAELHQPRPYGRFPGLCGDPHPRRGPPHQQQVTRRISRRQRQQPPRLGRQTLQLPPETVLDPPQQRHRRGQPEPARQLRRSQPPRQLQQRQRVTPRLGHDQVPHPRIQRPGQRRIQQRPRILLPQPRHRQLRQPGQLRPRHPGREHQAHRLGRQPPRHKPQRLHRGPHHPAPRRPPGQVIQQHGLAYPGLTAHHQHPAAAAPAPRQSADPARRVHRAGPSARSRVRAIGDPPPSAWYYPSMAPQPAMAPQPQRHRRDAAPRPPSQVRGRPDGRPPILAT